MIEEKDLDPRSFFKKYVATRQPAVIRYAQDDGCPNSNLNPNNPIGASSIIRKFWSNHELREKSGGDTIRCEIRDDITTEGRKKSSYLYSDNFLSMFTLHYLHVCRIIRQDMVVGRKLN